MILLGIDPSVIYPSAEPEPVYNRADPLAKIGDYPYPTNPLNDRAKGYLLAGKIKNAVTNFGNIIEGNYHPSGLWGDYASIWNVSFLAGISGHAYSSDYFWIDDSDELSTIQSNTYNLELLCSQGAYDDWSYYEAVVFDMEDDKGTIGEEPWDDANSNGIWDTDETTSIDELDSKNQFWVDDGESSGSSGRVCIALNKYEQIDPEKSSSMIGLAYPWAVRPKFIERPDPNTYDVYDYGDDREEWTDDDVYEFYGYNTTESWYALTDPRINTNWQAAADSRINSHSSQVTSGDIFGSTFVTDEGDTYPILAHSNLSNTWPLRYNLDTGIEEPFWPGW